MKKGNSSMRHVSHRQRSGLWLLLVMVLLLATSTITPSAHAQMLSQNQTAKQSSAGVGAVCRSQLDPVSARATHQRAPISEFRVPSHDSLPVGITQGPDHAL